MTQPITVYPTDAQGIYLTKEGWSCVRFNLPAWAHVYCVHCLRLLDAPSREHWYVDGHMFCHRCVVVADQEKGP